MYGISHCSTIKHFVSEITLGHIVTMSLGNVVTLIIVCIFGMNRGNCDVSTKIVAGHRYSYQINSVRFANRKFLRWPRINQCTKPGRKCTNVVCQNDVLKMLNSSLNVPG